MSVDANNRVGAGEGRRELRKAFYLENSFPPTPGEETRRPPICEHLVAEGVHPEPPPRLARLADRDQVGSRSGAADAAPMPVGRRAWADARRK